MPLAYGGGAVCVRCEVQALLVLITLSLARPVSPTGPVIRLYGETLFRGSRSCYGSGVMADVEWEPTSHGGGCVRCVDGARAGMHVCGPPAGAAHNPYLSGSVFRPRLGRLVYLDHDCRSSLQ